MVSTPNIDLSRYRIDPSNNSKELYSVIKEPSLSQVEKEFNGFESINFDNPKQRKELLEISPEWLFENANPIDYGLFNFISRYDKNNNTFVVGVFNNSGDDLRFEIISYKKRRVGKIKWMTRKGTHPNNMPFVRIYRDDTPIYIVEGHHDMLTAILLGLDFIMLPTAGFYDISNIIDAFIDSNLVFIVEDERAYRCMRGIALRIKDIAKRITLLELSCEQKKVDLSDYVKNFKTIEEVINGLQDRR